MEEIKEKVPNDVEMDWLYSGQKTPAQEETAVAQDRVTEQKTVSLMDSNKPEENAKQQGRSAESITFRENFRTFGPLTALYAVFYAFCMYKNSAGITYPFFLAGSLFYFCFTMEKLGLTLKKGTGFYMVSTMLLAISTFCTDDYRIIGMNKTGIFLLMISFLLTQFCNTEKWRLGKYLVSIPAAIISSIGELARPVSDAVEYMKKQQGGGKKKGMYVVLGLVIALPVFGIILMLLASADAVFREFTGTILESLKIGNVIGIVFQIVFWYFAVYMLMANLCEKRIKEEVKDHRNGEPILAITVTSMLSALYLVFSIIQILYLFIGNMQLPEGYTYAEYAREGFFQLLAVSIINLVIVLICMGYFRSSRILKAVLTVMSLCTFIMIASSAMRMIIYIQYFYLTFLRILVLWGLAVLFLLFAGVLVSIYSGKFELFRYGMTVVSVFYIALSFAHPDYWIAKVNTANAPSTMEAAQAFWKGGKDNGSYAWKITEDSFFLNEEPYHDYGFLADLSADAAPVLIPWLKNLGYELCVFDIKVDEVERNQKNKGEMGYWGAVEYYSGQKNAGRGKPEGFGYYYLWNLRNATDHMGLRSFNLSRYAAVKLVEEYK